LAFTSVNANLATRPFNYQLPPHNRSLSRTSPEHGRAGKPEPWET
jgi:hypothetical protein